MTSPPSPLVSRWAGDAAWLGMDASARGFHTQLLLIAAQRQPVGTLPDDDTQWRRWLGLPEAVMDENPETLSADGAVAELMGQSLRQGLEMGVSESLVLALHPQAKHWRHHQGLWMEHLWNERWKLMLLEAWPLIDAHTIAAHPHLKGMNGHRFCAMAMDLSQLPGLPVNTAAMEVLTGHPKMDAAAIKRPAARRGKRSVAADPLLMQLLSLSPDIGPLQDTDHVISCFRAVPLPEQRQTLWDLGVRVLTQSPEEAKGARAYLSSLIQKYGEQAVAKAVGEVAVKAIPPADAKAYLMGVLRQELAGEVAWRFETQR
jgi:hypothetical protein